jgi:hypothetical protein
VPPLLNEQLSCSKTPSGLYKVVLAQKENRNHILINHSKTTPNIFFHFIVPKKMV